MAKINLRRALAASTVIGALAAPGVAQAKPRPSIQSVSINSANRSGSKFKVTVQAGHANLVGVCVAFRHTTACEYATQSGTSFTARFDIPGARRSSRIAYSIAATGRGGHRSTSGSLVENSGTGTTSIG
ncbi:MAG TPA: hypothetical protein VG410_09115 [Solirubrobacteraceae bacterium]|jgi:hypothetical protein|nr:hypothetical protein [Solirubrobacteraceae bacterium]